MIRILFVDDDAAIRRLVARLFPEPAYHVDLAESGQAGLDLLAEHDYDAIISDFRMPKMDGGEFLARACDQWPETARILVTAESDFDVAVRAVNRGEVFRLIAKPWEEDALHFAVRLAVEMRNMRRERDQMLQALEEKSVSLARLNQELATVNRQLEQRVDERTHAVVESLVAALDFRDANASRRARRIAAVARRLAEQLQLTHAEVEAVERGALLHDVGRLGIRDDLYFKRAPLTEDEWVEVRRHPCAGDRMLRRIAFLEEARRIVLHHRECWDGSGYPSGLSGERISLGARVFAVAEILEEAVAQQPAGEQQPIEAVRAELERLSGRQFDPDVVCAALAVPAGEWPRTVFGGPAGDLREVA